MNTLQLAMMTLNLVWAMEYYQEHLRGRIFILNTNHKQLETLVTLHMKTMNHLQLPMTEFDFEIV
jgi:hypothetical protein